MSKTLIERTEFMLHTAHLPEQYWAEAAYITNRYCSVIQKRGRDVSRS